MENYLDGFINSLSEDAFAYVLNQMCKIKTERKNLVIQQTQQKSNQDIYLKQSEKLVLEVL